MISFHVIQMSVSQLVTWRGCKQILNPHEGEGRRKKAKSKQVITRRDNKKLNNREQIGDVSCSAFLNLPDPDYTSSWSCSSQPTASSAQLLICVRKSELVDWISCLTIWCIHSCSESDGNVCFLILIAASGGWHVLYDRWLRKAEHRTLASLWQPIQSLSLRDVVPSENILWCVWLALRFQLCQFSA